MFQLSGCLPNHGAMILVVFLLFTPGLCLGVDVPYTFNKPVIDGKVGFGEWTEVTVLELDNGFMALAHDNYRLYVLIDMLDDDGDDPYVEDGNDQFWLLFDVDEDSVLTPDLDLRYRLSPDFGNLRYQTFCEACEGFFNPLGAQSFSSRAEGFGCFLGDFTAWILPLSCSAHRVWELTIDFSEIEASDRSTRFGYRVSSGDPAFSEQAPADHLDIANYMDLNFVLGPRGLAASELGDPDVQFEVTQAIQTPENELDLAAGKPTAVRIWNNESNSSTFKNYIYGTVEGLDLPGSPILSVDVLSTFFRGDPRNSVEFNSFNSLPAAWTEPGSVEFDIEIRTLDQTFVATLGAEIDFLPTVRPVFWTVPVRNHLEGGTVAEPDPSWIRQSEQALRSSAPIRSIDFVRRPVLDVQDISDSESMQETLKQYDFQSLLAWSFMAFLTGEPAYDLPDQITGFSTLALSGYGGSSDPVWYNQGSARVSWVSPDALHGPHVYVHELNHNLDTDSSGTWGRHSRGCAAAGTDPAWPYTEGLGGESFTIQEAGIAHTDAGFISVSEETPDLMSYCISESYPPGWMSPYRWAAWLDLFEGETATTHTPSGHSKTRAGPEADFVVSASPPVDSYYIMGRVYPGGGGELGQVLRQPGMPTGNDAGGDYTLRVLDCEDGTIDAADFSGEFFDVEGEPLSFVSFSFVLEAPPEACSIVLEYNGESVQMRAVSANPPWINLLSPIGGEFWDDIDTVVWEAGDIDGDSLFFTLMYSPDGGEEWHSIATGIPDNHYEFDSSHLPGSNNAVIRVLASDGAHTSYDQSPVPFSVADKPPVVVIVMPAAGSVHDVNGILNLDGYAQDVLGYELDPSSLLWRVDGNQAGAGSPLGVNLGEGEHLVELLALDGEEIAASTSITITMAGLGDTRDPEEDIPRGIDIASVSSFINDDLFICEMVLRSGGSGLIKNSQFTCHIDFDDTEFEADTNCEADGNAFLDGEYQLGTNGACSTSDKGLNYRHIKNGGECTGGPGIFCTTEEFSEVGTVDSLCDGTVGGEDAANCRIRISLPLSLIRSERDAQCAPDDCLGGVDEFTGEYRAYLFFESRLRKFRDRVPDTNDGMNPNSSDEVLYSLLR